MEHNHLFELSEESLFTLWFCPECGKVAPGCFVPVESAVTSKGLIDLYLNGEL
jgi:hypothetical protein